LTSKSTLRFIGLLGFIISIILLFIVFYQLDWNTFFINLKNIQPFWILAGGLLFILGVAVRSLRWNVIAGYHLNNYSYFWKSMNLGYFANMIYPARTGEIIRMITIHHYVGMPQGKAISSVIVDRISDISVIGIFLIFFLFQHAAGFTWGTGFLLLIAAFSLLAVSLIVFIYYGNKIKEKFFFLVQKCPEWIVNRFEIWYSQAYEGVQTLRKKDCVIIIIILSFFAFLFDSLALYSLLLGFGWMLPITAAFYLAIFLQVGSILPSAPGYIGIYQIACVLSLGIFGIDSSAAIAYSIILQILSFVIFLLFGGVIALRDGFHHYKFDNTSEPNYNN
jgi:uncharacterized protein (TIRG00374 family)